MGVAVLAGLATTAFADDTMHIARDGGARRPGTVQLAIVDERGAPVYCTRDLTDGHARPDRDGGYQVEALRPGRWIVSLELPYERVDVMVTATSGGTVVVPPVVARGRCHSIALTRRLDLRQLVAAQPATWSVSFDRTYSIRAAAPQALRTRLRPPYDVKPKVATRPLGEPLATH
jgi:hypothetical protein